MTIYRVEREKENNDAVAAQELEIGPHTITHNGSSVPLEVLDGEIVRIEPKKIIEAKSEVGNEGRISFRLEDLPMNRDKHTLMALEAFEIPKLDQGDRIVYIHGYDTSVSVERWERDPIGT